MSTLNDAAWNKIFASPLAPMKNIEEKGYFIVSAEEIKKYGEREPRLITKIDHIKDAPAIFKEHGLSILPTKRGEYTIGRFQTHERIKYDEQNIEVEWKSLPSYVHTINPTKITSESIALNAAQLSGMLSDFAGEEVNLTIDGRMSSGNIKFQVETFHNQCQTLHVSNSQMEIDGGYEGNTKLMLIEAKNREAKDFLIRQLYYPYAVWSKRVKQKLVIPVFMTYVDNIYTFFEYRFKNPAVYNSLELVRVKHYALQSDSQIQSSEIDAIIQKYERQNKENRKDPFPQANNILRVLDLVNKLECLVEPELDDDSDDSYIVHPTNKDIAAYYNLNERQGGYYGNALTYLGLAKKKGTQYHLTELGKKVQKSSIPEKTRIIIEQMLQYPVLRKAYQEKLKTNHFSKSVVEKLMDEYVPEVGGSTRGRRASSILAWLQWIDQYYQKSAQK